MIIRATASFVHSREGEPWAEDLTRRISIFVMLVCVAQKYDEIDHPSIRHRQ